MKLKPVGDNLIVVPDEAKTETDGGVLIPISSAEKPKTGEVIAIGQGKFNSLRGEYVPMPFLEGDRVMYKPHAGLRITVSNGEQEENALRLSSEDIMFVIEE